MCHHSCVTIQNQYCLVMLLLLEMTYEVAKIAITSFNYSYMWNVEFWTCIKSVISNNAYIYIYMYICMYVCMYIYIYVYIMAQGALPICKGGMPSFPRKCNPNHDSEKCKHLTMLPQKLYIPLNYIYGYIHKYVLYCKAYITQYQWNCMLKIQYYVAATGKSDWCVFISFLEMYL